MTRLEDGLVLAILLAAGKHQAMHDYALGAGISEAELERVLNGPLCRMFASLAQLPTFEEELETALGEAP